MSSFTIPDIYSQGFRELNNLGQNDFLKLVEFISKVKEGMGPNSFINELEVAIPEIMVKEIGQVIYSFGTLLLMNEGKSINQIASDLAKSLNKKFDDIEIEPIYERLSIILNKIGSLRATTKAVELLGENYNVYLDSRIISDIRVVFDDELHAEKYNALIIHNLRLLFRNNDEDKEFYLSLDFADLIKLKENIDRALEKHNSLTSHTTFNFIKLND